MSPVLEVLLEQVGCSPAPRPERTDKERLAHVVMCCSNLVGFIQTNGITPTLFARGRDIARLADRTLPPVVSASFAPLTRLEETLANNPRWSFIDIAAHIASTATSAVKRSEA